MLSSRSLCHVLGLAALGAAVLGPGTSRAHFVLQAPAASYEQNQLGDPQKAPPCGDNGGAVPTGAVTAYQAGDTITITIDETIFHPGHYRVALAVSDISELPDPPPVTPNDTPCGTAPIQDPPVFPVLADGVFVHTEPFAEPQSIDIPVPADVSCDNCTLQIIQFMSDHGLNNPGGCYYHHCATISIQPGTPGTTTSAGESGSEGDSGSTDVTTTVDTTVTTTATSQGDTASATTTPGSTGPGSTGAATMTAGESTSGGSVDDMGGCGCSGAGGGLTSLAGLLGLLGLRRRRTRPRTA